MSTGDLKPRVLWSFERCPNDFSYWRGQGVWLTAMLTPFTETGRPERIAGRSNRSAGS